MSSNGDSEVPVPNRARSKREDFREFYRLQTRWMDNDIYGHLNNVTHYSLFDTAVNGWLIESGILDPRLGETHFLVAESGCRYHAEISFPSIIDAGLRVARIGTSSVRYEIGLFESDQVVSAADGVFVHVNVSRGSHKPVPICAEDRTALQRLVARSAD